VSAVIRYPIVFMPLFAPFGISSGYVSVTLGFLLARAGVSTAIIGALIALSVWPQTWKMFWAPVVDTVGNPKLWYGLGTTLVGGTILLMSVLPMTQGEIGVFSTLIVISSIASTAVSMSTEIFMANQTPAELRGRASGWSQAGNLGGAGIGGGLGLLLAEHVPHAWVSGAVLAAICFNDEPAFGACEVGDVAPDRLLSPEFEPAKLAIAQSGPQPALGIRRFPSKRSRVRVRSSDRRHGCFLEEGKPSPNPLPRAGEG